MCFVGPPTISRRNSSCLLDGSVQVLLVSGVLELQDMQNEQGAEQKVVMTHKIAREGACQGQYKLSL